MRETHMIYRTPNSRSLDNCLWDHIWTEKILVYPSVGPINIEHEGIDEYEILCLNASSTVHKENLAWSHIYHTRCNSLHQSSLTVSATEPLKTSLKDSLVHFIYKGSYSFYTIILIAKLVNKKLAYLLIQNSLYVLITKLSNPWNVIYPMQLK